MPKNGRLDSRSFKRAAKGVSIDDQQYMKLVASVVEPLAAQLPKRFNQVYGALRSRNVDHTLRAADALVSQQYSTSWEHFQSHQVASLIRKYPWTSPTLDPKGTAIKKFLRAERKCRRVNRKVRLWAHEGLRLSPYKRRRHTDSVRVMRDFIKSVLGPFNLELVQEKCDFSGGANIGVHGNATNIYQKLQGSDWSVTRPALSYALQALWNNSSTRHAILPGDIVCYDKQLFADRVRAKVVYVDYNKLSTVSKTAKTERTIAVEPVLNGFLQHGVDRYMRARLKIFGIDLSKQSRNSYLAQRGSEMWETANPWVTIDLANASGSISDMLVKLLLPSSWYEYLDAIRSACYKMQGTDVSVRYESFVSMGNGFCFPLESLIFAAFCKAAGSSDFAVYGDDIIVRRNDALYLMELLSYFGFETNAEKSFVTGPFRESCGADWYAGEDVRPCVVDKQIDSLSRLYAVHNGTLRNRLSTDLLQVLRRKLRESIPDGLKLCGLRSAGLFHKDPLTNKLLVADTYLAMHMDACMSSPYFNWDRDRQAWRWYSWQATPLLDPESVNATSNVDMYAVLRGATPQEHGPKSPFFGENGRPLHTLRYNVRRRLSGKTFLPTMA